MFVPAGVAATACTADAQAAVGLTLLDAAANATMVNAGAASCSLAAARRRVLAVTAIPANCSTSATSRVSVTFLTSIIVPAGGNAGLALSAINALTFASYEALTAALSAASGCPAAAFVYASTTTASACGSAASDGAVCRLPDAAPAAGVNTNAIIGGVLGGFAALAIFVAAVLITRGACVCCCGAGSCCPRLPRKQPSHAAVLGHSLKLQSFFSLHFMNVCRALADRLVRRYFLCG
jgi:hypothetical protein